MMREFGGYPGSDIETNFSLDNKQNENIENPEQKSNVSEVLDLVEKDSPEIEAKLENIVEDVTSHAEQIKSLVESIFPDRSEEERDEILAQLQSVEGKAKYKSILKNYLYEALPKQISVGAIAGFVMPMLAKTGLKSSFRIFLASKTFGTSVAAGALAGVVFEPIRYWWKNRKKVVAEDIKWQLDAAADLQEKAAIIGKAKEQLKAGKFHKADQAQVKEFLQQQIIEFAFGNK
jgi:hypothetical protein